MKQLLATMTAIALAVLFVSPRGASAQAADPLTVVVAFNTAMNAHSVDAALALFADDAVFTAPAGTFVGKEQIRRYLQILVERNYQAENVTNQVSGDRVTSSGQVSLDEWRRLGVAPLEVASDTVVRDGQIRSFTVGFTPASLARLQAAEARARPVPAQLPRTGGALSLADGGLIAAGIALLLGLALRRRTWHPGSPGRDGQRRRCYP